jgi:hypothetical protein
MLGFIGPAIFEPAEFVRARLRHSDQVHRNLFRIRREAPQRSPQVRPGRTFAMTKKLIAGALVASVLAFTPAMAQSKPDANTHHAFTPAMGVHHHMMHHHMMKTPAKMEPAK